MKRPLQVIVVGGGVAGMAFALRLLALKRHQDVHIRLLSKAGPEQSSSHAAQGGVAAVIQPSDSWEQHRDDTLTVGAGRCDPRVVEQVVREGPRCIQELLDQGARFDTDAQGRLDAAREGGHGRARVVHRGDRTGAELVRVLRAQVQLASAITTEDTVMALDLLVEQGPEGPRCQGVRTVDVHSGAITRQYADVVVLATGGVGQVYRHTTNPEGATGSGVAMSLRAGLPLRDMAFVQFHPTALHAPDQPGTFLISEAVRGAGAVLLHTDGSPLMAGVHPMADLAPRNVVARAIHAEMQQHGVPHVWLDATRINRLRFAREFPMILDHCWSIGLDPAREPIPVMPAAHYLCGGIRIDGRGRTALPGLYALGECAGSGLHGADRLASNSLLEALVIPRHAAADVATWNAGPQVPNAPVPEGQFRWSFASEATLALRQALRDRMMDQVGIVRSNAGLKEARATLDDLRLQVEAVWAGGERSTALAELRDMVCVGSAICAQAIAERVNAGTHWNQDLEAAQVPVAVDQV